MKLRYEQFGGIVFFEKPPLTIYVGRDLMRKMVLKSSKLWESAQNYLSAPLSVDLTLTKECPLQCRHCYQASFENIEEEPTTQEVKKIIDFLAALKVFQISFGGGEPFSRPDLLELALYARKKGIVPNVTTNGYYITKEIAMKCKVFGAINVSLDGIEERYSVTRGVDGFEYADTALYLLVKARANVGINTVVSCKNYDHLEEIARYAREKNVRNMVFMRYKPKGRGVTDYEQMKLTREQAKGFFNLLRKITFKYRILVQIDCGLAPFICYHKPNFKYLDFFALQGCVGGDTFIEVKIDKGISACSFCKDSAGNIFDFNNIWRESPHFQKFREWEAKAKEPCNSCHYLRICKGGCHIVSEYVNGDFFAPDPECLYLYT